MTTRITPGLGANLIGQHAQERNQDATAYVGNLDPQASEDLLWELFTQAGPVSNVYVPKDRVSNLHQGFGFVEFRSEEDADYAVKIMNMIKLFGKPIRVNKASQDRRSSEIGANLFIGNLDPDVDEKLLYDTFSAFGIIANNPKIMRDPETGNSKGFGFVSYSSFEGSDAAIEAMNGQYLCNRAITVQYAYKKDSRGERHGTPAERLLAANNPSNSKFRPNTLFSAGPGQAPTAAGQAQAAPGGMPPPPGPGPAPPMPPPVPPGQPPAPPSGFGGPPPPPSGFGQGPPPPPSGFGQGPPPPPRPPGGYQPQSGPYGAQLGGQMQMQMPMQMPFRPPPPPGAGGYAQGGPPRPPGGPPPPWAQQQQHQQQQQQYPPPPGGNMPQPPPLGQPGMVRPPWMTGPQGGGMPGGMPGGRGPPPPPGQPGGVPPWGMGGPPPPPPAGYMGQPPPPQ